jgi:hypothetical protein
MGAAADAGGGMYLVQLLLPLADGDGRRMPREAFDQVRRELTERFGGATLYLRAPAEGAWKDAGGEVEQDDVVVAEVMVHSAEREWWMGYRAELEQRFGQEELLARLIPCEML